MSTLKLQFLIECVDGATKKVRDIQASVDKATKPVRDIGQGFANVHAKITDLANAGGMQRVSAAWDGFAKRVRAMPMIAAISMAGVVAAVSRTEQQLESAVRTAMKIGMPTAQFQQMSFAAKQAGLGPEELAHGMQHLARTMVEGKQGSKEAMAWFKLVGVSAKDLKTMRPYDVMMRIADTFQRVGDVGQNSMIKTALLTGLMSRSGPELKGFFDQGGAGIKAFMEQADKMGVGLTETEAKGVISFAQSVGRLTASIDVMMARIVTRLNPALSELIDNMTGKNVKNGATIVKVVGDALEALLKAMPKMLVAFGGMSKAVVMLFEVLDKIANAVGGWSVIFGAFAAVFAVKMVLAMVSLTQAAYALGVAMLSTPFGWVALGVAALVVAGYQLYKHWDGFKQFWVDLWTNAKAAFLEFVAWFEAAMKPMETLIGTLLGPDSAAQRFIDRMPAVMRVPEAGPGGHGIVYQPQAVPSAFARAQGGQAGGLTQRQEVGGELRITIDDNRATQVTGLRKAPGGVLDLTLDNGTTLSSR